MLNKLVLASLLSLSLITTSFNAASAEATAQANCQGLVGLTPQCPIRIRFARGSYGALVNGVLTRTPDTRYYAVSARAGQRMIVTFTGLGAMRGGINFPGGSGDGPYNGEGNALTLPANGDYIIYLGQNTMAGNLWRGGFTLSVLVR